MDFKRFASYLTIAGLMVTSLSANAQLQLSCAMDWSALTNVDTAKPDQLIAGIKASDWTKKEVDQMLSAEEECARTGSDPESVRQAKLIDIQTRAYPNALRNIEARDQRLLHEKTAISSTEKVAHETADNQHVTQASQQSQPSMPQSLPTQPTPQNEQAQGSPHDPTSNQNMLIALAVVGCGIGLWFWSKFIRNRCPNCKAASFDRISETEMDRWRGTKAVSERNSRGTKTRHVQATFVHLQFEYKCRHCQHEWMKVRKEELGSASKLIRFFSGY